MGEEIATSFISIGYTKTESVNMIIKSGDLSLHTIGIDDIELLRNWRNEREVNQYLLSSNYISAQDQQRWFSSLDPATSIYFLLQVGNKKIGMVYASGINEQELSFEGSIFIGEKDFANTFYPVKAALMLSYLFFEKAYFEKAYSTVNRKNTNAMDLDSRLGYKEILGDKDFVKSECTREAYFKHTEVFKKMFFRNDLPEIITEEDDSRFTFYRSA